MIIEGECRLITEHLNLLTPNYLRKYLILIIDHITFLNVTDDNLDVLLKSVQNTRINNMWHAMNIVVYGLLKDC